MMAGMRWAWVTGCVAAWFAGPAAADLVGVRAGGGLWNYDPQGSIELDGNAADLEEDLGLESEMDTTYWIDFDTPPLIPGIQARFNRLKVTGATGVGDTFDFGGTSFTAGTTVNSAIDLDHYDVTVYYGLPIPFVNLDLGLNAKIFDGTVEVSEETVGREQRDVTGGMPMVYGRARVDVPQTNFFATGEGMGFAFDTNRIWDYEIKAGYEIKLGFIANATLGASVGYRNMGLLLEDIGPVRTDVEVDGVTAGVYLGVGIF